MKESTNLYIFSWKKVYGVCPHQFLHGPTLVFEFRFRAAAYSCIQSNFAPGFSQQNHTLIYVKFFGGE